MRHIARRLFTRCSAVSLLLCVVACVLWVRSSHTADVLIADRRNSLDWLLQFRHDR